MKKAHVGRKSGRGARKQNAVGMTEAQYNQPYDTRVKFKGSQPSNNGSARVISGGNKRGRA